MNYIKDFQTWSQVKQSIQDRSSTPPGYKVREVWWAQLGVNIGDEEDGKGKYFSRPVLIVRGFSKYLIWAVPLTSAQKSGEYYHPIILDGVFSVIILSQLRALDRRRLTTRIGILDEQHFEVVKEKLAALMS